MEEVEWMQERWAVMGGRRGQREEEGLREVPMVTMVTGGPLL